MLRYNNREIVFGKFPNGEVYLQKIRRDERDITHVVTFKYESDDDFFKLLLVRKELQDLPVTLRITYVPYSRMDRESTTYTFSLKVFADFINSMNWEKVVIYEPHSDVTPALLDRVQVVNVTGTPIMESNINIALSTPNYQVFYPDAGAQKRYAEAYRNHSHLVGFKTRDFETGKILDSSVVGTRTHDNVAIIDDLCSKGGTFVLAAEKLREMGFKRIILAVAHCENTIFEGGIFVSGLIDRVITTDSILTINPLIREVPNLRVIPLSYFSRNSGA